MNSPASKGKGGLTTPQLPNLQNFPESAKTLCVGTFWVGPREMESGVNWKPWLAVIKVFLLLVACSLLDCLLQPHRAHMCRMLHTACKSFVNPPSNAAEHEQIVTQVTNLPVIFGVHAYFTPTHCCCGGGARFTILLLQGVLPAFHQ